MTVAEKQRQSLDEMREPAVACPRCETQTTAADLLRHIEERCQGPREPHPQSKWITWLEARTLGASDRSLRRWVDRKLVRVQGEPWRRRYLLRDVAKRLAHRSGR